MAVGPDTALPEIAATFVAQGFGGAPVVDESDRVIGFVAEIDLMDALLRDDPKGTLAKARRLVAGQGSGESEARP